MTIRSGSTISGGYCNLNRGYDSFIGGGYCNWITSSNHSSIGGGCLNLSR